MEATVDAIEEIENPRLAIDGWRATLTLSRPERHNALGVDDIEAFVRVLDHIDALPDIRVLVVTGSGDKTFCAGFALDEVGVRDREVRAAGKSPFEALTDRLERMRVPTICALNGSVYGGGGELALCCDFRIGIKGMRMFVPPARLGIHYPPIGLRRYIERLGLSVAKRVLVGCETFDDAELHRIGFLDHLVAPSELHARVDAMAGDLAALAPLSVQSMKATLNEIARGTMDPQIAAERVTLCGRSADHQEALAARREKRKPVFTGR
jgi:enoyl-CoA hydratase/carnithine racemase